jgi:CHAT domain-containing protein/tetratricopeptide (TPR) repeat protein
MLIKISHAADDVISNQPSQSRCCNLIGLSAMICVATLFCISCSTPVDALDADRTRVTALMQEANAFLVKKDTDAAIESLKKAYTLSQSEKDYLASATLHNQIGEIYELKGRYQEALMQYEQGIKIIAARQTGSGDAVAEALERLRAREKGYTAADGEPIGTDLYRGRTDNLIELLSRSASNLESELSISLMVNAGNMYLSQNQYPQAHDLYQKAIEIAKKAGLKHRTGKIYANLAWGALKRHQLDEVETFLQTAMSGIDADSPPVELRRALLALGVHYREKGNFKKATEEINKAVELYKRAEDLTGQCRALTHLATAYFKQGKFQKAKTRYLKALELNEQVNDDIVDWHASGGLAKTLYQLGDLKGSIKFYEAYMKAVDRYSHSYLTDQGRVAILEDHAAVMNEYVGVTADLAKKTGNFESARKAIEQVRAKALKLLIETKQSRTSRKPGTLPAGPVLYGEQWPYYQIELSAYIAGQSSPGVVLEGPVQAAPAIENPGDPNPLDDEAPDINERPTKAEPGEFPGSSTPSSKDSRDAGVWQQTTPPGVTFLQTYVLSDRTVILITRAGKLVGGAVADITAKSLTGLIEQYRRSIQVDKPRGVVLAAATAAVSSEGINQTQPEADISKILYGVLLEPVRDLLPGDPQNTVVIIPHQILWLLPFAALRDKNGEFFGDQRVLTYAVSESTWRLIARRIRTADHNNVRAWVVGNPDMPRTVKRCDLSIDMDQLPGAEQEALEIADLFSPEQVELFTGPLADRLRLDAWHPGFSVLHLATHGVACSKDPLSSFIVLKSLNSNDLVLNLESGTITLPYDSSYPVTLVDAKKILKDPIVPLPQAMSYPGLLDARTIISEYNLDADLVTLSACQTGLGQLTGEGLIGFTRAFLTSGARSLLVSLWRVDDQSTKDLMVSFYRQYLEHGNKGLALKRAMAEARKRYPEPRYWAGFTLLGMSE